MAKKHAFIEVAAPAIGGIVIIAVALLAIAALFSVPVWLLWNWLCPQLFGLPAITIWQAFGLNMLCGCLFRSSAKSK